MNDRITYSRIHGPLTQSDIRFGVYLPPTAHLKTGERYPVLYYLHGLNEDYTTHLRTVVAAIEKAVHRGIMPPVIMVAPDGYGNAMWSDSKDGRKPAETHVIRELIPHVDAVYPTLPDRNRRIIAGFSMGGFGACRYAVTYPELFGICMSMDGAHHTLDTMRRIRGPVFEEIFDNDTNYYRRYCLFENARKNADTVRETVRFHILIGGLSGFNNRMRRRFEAIGIPIADAHFIQTDCGHDVACILDKEGLNALMWIGRWLSIDPVPEAQRSSDGD